MIFQERLASIEALSSIVRSLSRDVDETREAIALLLDLSDIPQVRQRIGRIKGSIVMLVTLRNAHEPGTHDDAEKLLHMLSSNPQNVLLMAEAGYFRPLIHYLKEGSLINHIVLHADIFFTDVNVSYNHMLHIVKDFKNRHFTLMCTTFDPFGATNCLENLQNMHLLDLP